jgi:hypothetical protein
VLPGVGFKPAKSPIDGWVVAQERMSELASLADLRGSERTGQSFVIADLRSVLVGFVLARTANRSVSYRRDDRAECERGQDASAAPFAALNRLADGHAERGQDNHSQAHARLPHRQRRRDPAADSIQRAPGHREPRDDQRPSDATGDKVTGFVAEQTGENVVAELAVAVAVYDLPGNGDAPLPSGVRVDPCPFDT